LAKPPSRSNASQAGSVAPKTALIREDEKS
jgi:hypothetical protein